MTFTYLVSIALITFSCCQVQGYGLTAFNANTERAFAVGFDAVNQVNPAEMQRLLDVGWDFAAKGDKDGFESEADDIRKALEVAEAIVKDGPGADSLKGNRLCHGVAGAVVIDPETLNNSVIGKLYLLTAKTAAEGDLKNAKNIKELAEAFVKIRNEVQSDRGKSGFLNIGSLIGGLGLGF